MTRYLFIDNFRGFSDTYIPIADVSFLVGENSSGKTSVLGLLKLLSSQEFVWGQKFTNKDVYFGPYHDMVSAHASDRSYFSFGFIDDQSAGPKLGPTAMFYTFREHDGLPRLAQFNSVVGKRQICLRFEGTSVLYKAKPLTGDGSLLDLRETVMPQWVDEHRSESAGYRVLKMPDGYRGAERYPLYMPWMVAIQQSHAKGDSAHPGYFFAGNELVWIAPIRTKPDRTYDDLLQSEFSPEGTHTPYLIRRVLQSATEAKSFKEFLKRSGKSSGLFESIQIRSHGNGVTAPFEVDAVLDGKALNLITVGYGVSQSLPVFVEIFTRPPRSWFAIQQPEVHLHPRAQAALGDAFFEMAHVDKKCFLIETHSDFTIDRFRMNYRKKGVKPHSQILFFERRDSFNTVTSLPIDQQGELPSDQPESYRQFFITEEMRVLDL